MLDEVHRLQAVIGWLGAALACFVVTTVVFAVLYGTKTAGACTTAAGVTRPKAGYMSTT